MTKTIERLIVRLTHISNRLKKERTGLLLGRLHVRKRRQKFQFIHYFNGEEHGITRSEGKIYSLARRTYVDAAITELDRIIEILSQVLTDPVIERAQASKREALNKFSMLNRDRIIHSRKDWFWTTRYRRNTFREHNKTEVTNGGVAMRSKSEKNIGNLLEALGIAYRYDSVIEINGARISPDFVILLPDGRKIIWEHLGMWDHPEQGPEYRARAMRHFELYRQAGYRLGVDLFYTFEEDASNPKALEDIINQFI